MYIVLHVVLSDFKLDCANVEKNENDRLIIHIQLNVDVKTNSHVVFLIVRQIKIDNKRIIRRQNTNVASRFLYCQNVVFFDL